MLLPPPFIPTFGTGDPTSNTSTTAPYYDTSTNPFTAWIYVSGAWNRYNVAVTGEATNIQGRTVDGTTPTSGQVLTWDAANSWWIGV